MKYVVSNEEHGFTLLVFLQKRNEGIFSVKKLKNALASNACRIDGKPETFPSRKLFAGEEIEFNPPLLNDEKSSFTILFQDEYFTVVNKPRGVVSEGASFHPKLGTPVHRLDKDTSGAILLARTPAAEERAKKLFSSRSLEKIYLALAEGEISENSFVIDNFLGKKGSFQGQTLYASVSPEKGARAITGFTVLSKNKKASLVLCDLKTGRTHQIRVHLSECGHPILGDVMYGAGSSVYLPERHLLHARKLAFTHPFTGVKIEITAEIPLDFSEAIKILGLKFSEKL